MDPVHNVNKRGFRDIAWIVFGLLTLSFVSIFFDTDITRYRRTESLPGDLRRIIQLSEIFAHGFGIAIIVYAIWILSPHKRWYLPRLAACAIVPGIVVQCFKLVIGRYRPAHFFPEYADHVADTWIGFVPAGQLNFEYVTQSFPSAHAATAVGLATGLIWMFPRCRGLIIFLALLASFQRVVAGAHWSSDVFAGAAISVLVCGIIFRSQRANDIFVKFENRSISLDNNNVEMAEFSDSRKAA